MKIKAIRLSQVIAYRKDQSKLKYDRFLSSGKYLLSKQNDDERIERLILKARDFVNTDEEVFEGENDGQYYPEFYGGVVAVTNAVLKEIEATGVDLSKAIIPLPYKEPSSTLFQMLGFVTQAGQKFADSTEQIVSDAASYGPVGTTMA